MTASKYLISIMGGTTAAEAVERASVYLLSSYFGADRIHLPIPIDGILDARNVQFRRSLPRPSKQTLDGSANAILLTRAGGFEIVLRIDLREDMRRFVCAHELAHTLFYVQEDSTATPVRAISPSEEEEQICDSIALRVLMPTCALDDYEFGGTPPEPETLVRAYKTFRVQMFHFVQHLWETRRLGKCVVVLWRGADGKPPVPKKILNREEESGWETESLRSGWDSGNNMVSYAFENGNSSRTLEYVFLGPLRGLRETTILCVDEGVRKVATIIPLH